MLNFILGALAMWYIWGLAFVIWQCTTRKDADEFVMATGGPVIWGAMLFCLIVGKLMKVHKRRKYRALVKYPDGIIRWCYSDQLDYLEGLTGKRVKPEDLKEYIHFWNEDKFASSMCIDEKTPNIRYAPPKVWKNFESEIKYIKKEN